MFEVDRQIPALLRRKPESYSLPATWLKCLVLPTAIAFEQPSCFLTLQSTKWQTTHITEKAGRHYWLKETSTALGSDVVTLALIRCSPLPFVLCSSPLQPQGQYLSSNFLMSLLFGAIVAIASAATINQLESPIGLDTNDGIQLAVHPKCGLLTGNYSSVNADSNLGQFKAVVSFGVHFLLQPEGHEFNFNVHNVVFLMAVLSLLLSVVRRTAQRS